jgi:hypothetical protein
MAEEGSKEQLEEIVNHLENEEDIRLENFKHKDPRGVGDTLEKVFSKFGVTEKTIEKFSGIGGCGCQKVKKFLNQIFPYRIAAQKPPEEKKEEPTVQENTGGIRKK